MKHFSTLSLMLLLALTWVVPKAEAQDFSVVQVWSTTWAGNAFWLQGAVSNDTVYTVPAVNSGAQLATMTSNMTNGYYIARNSIVGSWSGGNAATAFPVNSSGSYYYLGPAITADSDGILWVSSLRSSTAPAGTLASNPWSSSVKALTYYTYRPNVYKNGVRTGVSLGNYATSGRADLMSVYGRPYYGTGYFWFTVEGGNKIERVTMTRRQPVAKTTFTAPVTNPYRSYTQQYADNKVLYVTGTNASTRGVAYRGVINSDGTITWKNLGVQTYSAGAAMFAIGPYEFLAYSSSNTQVTVQALDTNGNLIADQKVTVSATQGNSGAMRHCISVDVQDDGQSAYIYVYSPGAGAQKFTFTMASAVPAAAVTRAEIVEDENPNYVGRQNTELVWTANAEWPIQPTSYLVQYKRSYYDTSNTLVEGSWTNVGTTTTLPTEAAPFVHNDVKYIKLTINGYGTTNVATQYAYRVIPQWNGCAGSMTNTSALAPKFIPIIPRWIHIFGEEAYPGVCMAQMFWEYPGYGLKPDGYDVLRDGAAISGDQHVAAFVHVDYNGKPNTTHQYEIATHYNGLDNSTPAKSSVKTVTFAARDWSIPKYSITEIYNFSIEDGEYDFESGANATNFKSRDCYPQATFRDGKWYVSQMYDDKVVRSNYGTDWQSYLDQCESVGSVGSVLIFDADAQAQSNGKMMGGKKATGIDIDVYANRGVAVDDAGNIFTRAPRPGITNLYALSHDFEYAMTTGYIYKPNSNGGYDGPYTVSFSGAGFNFAEMVQDTGGPLEGRCDYFSMKGDVFSSEGAYLYVAPTQTKAVYVIKLTASGTTITASKVGVYFEHGTNQQSGAAYKSSIENYAFPVNCEGREGNQFVYNLRSNIFRNLQIDNSGTTYYNETLYTTAATLSTKPYSYNVSGVEGYAAADQTKNVEGRIYDFHSRVNNPGGATFEFNGELFIVTPISQYSINTGSFYVGRGFRPTLSIDPVTGQANRAPAKDADLCNIVPVATVYQSDESSAAFSNAAGVWCYGEVPDIAEEAARGLNADEDGDGKADYAYIYVYAPGQRFAKYRLDPDALFPPSPNEVEIVPSYERDYVDGEHNAGGDLLKYDAVVTWEPMENSYNTQGVGNYSVESYTITLCYEDGTPVLDENGNPLTVTIPVYNPATGESSEYVVLDENGNVVNYTYTFPDVDLYDENGKVITYTSKVVVNYKGNDGTPAESKTQVSVETEDQAYNDYEAVAPEGKVNIGVAEDWADWDGNKEKTKDDGYWNRFTIELEPTNPTWTDDQRPEPVSHYTIWVSSEDSETNDADKGNKQICDFYLYDPDSDTATEGVQNVTGLTPDEKGYVHITDCLIPGDYVFTPDDGIPDIYWIEVDYTGGTNGTAAELKDGKINPEEWTYTITADYAAGNEKISKSASNDMEEGGVPTGVEVINVQSSLSVYPVPATTSVTVKSSDAINTVAIYSAAGVQVKAVECAGENVVVVSVDDLAAGNYYVKVNNLKPVKIVKK